MRGGARREGTPRLDGLRRFLKAVKELGPTSVYHAARESGLPYITAYRYMRYCLEKGLVASLREGGRGSLQLILTDRGQKLLEALKALTAPEPTA